ncbi:MAG: glucose-6-phosphate isomerase [Actinobacteria bacterium]|nr:glucose-6-phosphate isomerase [Actinomycetota bacterium]
MIAIQRLIEADAVSRLVRRDASLFAPDFEKRKSISNRLGWTDLAERGDLRAPLVETLKRAITEEGATDVVLLGMGGSSLAALVFERVFGTQVEGLKLHVLDTVDPQTVAKLMAELTPANTWFLLSSKSGATIEPLSLYRVFRAWMNEHMEGPAAGKRFVVITDPDSPMQALRTKEFMRMAINAPANVGGRYSALSLFGLTPAGLLGVDLKALLKVARAMEVECAKPAEENPAAKLAAWIADNHTDGRDKLTFIASPGLESFGLWVEQLVAESTGKSGIGVVPVIADPADDLAGLGSDRAVFIMRDANDPALAELTAALQGAGHPVFEVTIDDRLALGAEFVRWKYATGLLGFLMGIDPFDEPNVSEAKQATLEVLEGKASPPPAVVDIDGVWPAYAGVFEGANPPADLTSALAPLAATRRPGDYLAVLVYLPYDDALVEPLRAALRKVTATTTIPSILQFGPRYLHSTGQLHKGGPDNGAFLVITARDKTRIPVPGSPYTLGELYRAQAEGDFMALGAHNRRVMRLDLPDTRKPTIARLALAIEAALG